MLNKTVYSIIPARGGSKGLPGKNVRNLAGKPLIAHTISASLGCDRISRSFVSTDDPEIKKVSIEWGAEVIDRPAEFATDLSRTHDALRHALLEFEKDGGLPEYFVLLQPTSPLRTSKDIQSCLDNLIGSGAKSAISVYKVDHNPYKDYIVKDDLLEPLFDEQSLEMRRQALPDVYRPNGAMYVMKSREFLDKGVFFSRPCMPFVMDLEISIDIDSLLDFSQAELILQSRNEKKSDR